MTFIRSTLTGVLLHFFLAGVLLAHQPTMDDSKTLEVKQETPKLEVWYSQIGFRDTLLFYTFADQSTVLKLQFDNKDTTFPVTGQVYLFADNIDEEAIKKWLNNQHSDGLFADAPKPIETIKIPDDKCRVTAHKFLEKSRARFGEFDSYEVEFEVSEYTDMRHFRMKKFSGKTKVHVKTN